HDCIDCIKAIIEAVVAQLQQELEEPGRHSSLRVLDMTRLSDSVSGCTPAALTSWSSTEALAKACMEVSKHQPEFQRRGPKRHKGCSGAARP
ncbi:LRC14 protein, partial [Buphagus erythrorhynchus]|nr:LRC14 protein [Buphagus erythrorhynchus]